MANLLSRFWTSKTESNATKQTRRIPKIDRTEPLTVNRGVTAGVFHNDYEGLKLAGALAFNPIIVPVYFMGVPSIISENEATQERLKDLIKEFSLKMQQINLECHRDGTVWIFPFFDANSKKLIWEAIPDESVKIIKNIDTGEPVRIITKETITVAISDDKEVSCNRTRVFTKSKITEKIEGGTIPKEISNRSRINVAGILPINFSNNSDLNELRGHSDLERILPDLKDYHDIDFTRSSMLSKFKAKMMIALDGNVEDWLSNNAIDDINDIDFANTDIFFSSKDDKIDFVFPATNAYDSLSQALKDKFKKVVEGSGVPEICWGLKIEGNSNTAEESMATLLNFVRDKQNQKTEKYKRLFEASLKILSISEMNRYDFQNIDVNWGMLDGISMVDKSNIFKNFADGINKIVGSASATKEQMLKFWKMFYPEETTEDIEKYTEGIFATAKHSSFSRASYIDIVDELPPIKGE